MPIGNERGIKIFTAAGALLEGHFRLTSGKDGLKYVAKTKLLEYGNEEYFEEVCMAMATDLMPYNVETVIGPESGAVKYADRIASILTVMTGLKVNAVHAFKCGPDKKQFCIKKESEALIAGKNCAIVEDVVTSGGSLKKVVDVTKEVGGIVIVATVLWNRGSITGDDVGVRNFISQINEHIPAYFPGPQCKGCVDQIPYDLTYGHGKDMIGQHPLAPMIVVGVNR